ncbi:hypothetical protein ANTPLA_LOCUS4313 [Anthophora plagiata]
MSQGPRRRGSFWGNSNRDSSRTLSVPLALQAENTLARVAVLALSWRSRLMQLTAQLSQQGSHTVTPATKPTPRRPVMCPLVDTPCPILA